MMQTLEVKQARYRTFRQAAATVAFVSSVIVAGVAQATPPPDALSAGFGIASAQSSSPHSPPSAAAKSTPQATKELSVEQRLDALLAESAQSDTERTSQRCISRRNVKRIEVLSSSLLLIEGRRDRYWVNQFPRKCVGLQRNMALAMEVRSSKLCAIDSIYGHDRFDSIRDVGFGSRGSARAHCTLSPFESVSAEQAGAIRMAAKNGAFR